jgi:uncharacterized iron-regulated membrane protein
MVKPAPMTRALVVLHRWLGVSFCLLFAMWFATGIVMHFVPFPALTETERIDGLKPIDPSPVPRGPAAAVTASGIKDASRVRLLQRSDGPVYVVTGASGMSAVRADDLSHAAVKSASLARSIAEAAARQRGLDPSRATAADLADYDQWTVPNGFDRHRPLYRIALNDAPHTELYVSSVTGEVVLDTTRYERMWNYAGSVTHWIYPTVLRRSQGTWDVTVWSLSLVALIAAIAGSVLGIIKLKLERRRIASPYQGWHKWHHVLGLFCMTFVLTWIFSGWLSMDHGRLFSTGKLSGVEAAAIADVPAWETLETSETRPISAQAREIEWFVFDRRFYRRDRTGLDTQLLLSGDSNTGESLPPRAFLPPRKVAALVERLAPGCDSPVVVATDDNYAVTASMPNAPVYRSVCGTIWFHIDGASGAMLERLDPSRRAYRWFYGALHTMDVPALAARSAMRSALIVILCGCGFVFSLTGVVIGWRRLRLQVSA